MFSFSSAKHAFSAAILTLASALLLLGSMAAKARVIEESLFVPAGGIEQWIEIRGKNERNPILLWLNGGPGGSTVPNSFAYEPWESRFTMVMWDQRGEGKTFARYGKELATTMSIEQMSMDGIDIAEYLHKRLPHAPIVLLGHSWGSVLGIRMVRARPDLFAAYVGTGQVTSLTAQLEATYPQLLAHAQSVGNEQAVQELMQAGAPSAENPTAYSVTDAWSAQFEPEELPAMESKRQPPEDRPDYLDAGEEFSWETLNDALYKEDIPSLGTDFSLPMFFIQGEYDYVTHSSKVREYFDLITAPLKKLIMLENHGHLAIFQDRDGFFDTLVKTVLPVIAN